MGFRISPRDRTITRRVLEGESCRHVAEAYGLTPSRVQQIVHETSRRASGWYTRPLAVRVQQMGSLRRWRLWYRAHPQALDTESVP